MDVYKVHDDGSEHLLASGLNANEVLDLEEWWRYTTPLGPSIKIVVRPMFQVAGLTVVGTEPTSGIEARSSEIFVG